MILNREMIGRIELAFDQILVDMNEDREESQHIIGIVRHEYYELSVPRGKDPTSKYLVEYKKVEHFLNTHHPDINLTSMTIGEIKEVLTEMLEVYVDAH